MTLRYERLAIAVFAAMLTTLLITEYASEHPLSGLDRQPALPQAGPPPAATTGP
jgi:hypothetical protein